MSPMFIGAFSAIAAIVYMAIKMYKRLIALCLQQKNAFSQIDVQLTRRYEIIPYIVEAARAFIKQDQETLERLILARNQAFQAKQNSAATPSDGEAMKKLLAAENGVKNALRSFQAVSESYPGLRSNENMKTLMKELASTENGVAFARQAFNDATMEYNTACEVFPANVFASSFKAAVPFKFEDEN
ncbi:MAG TPA: LemA family protein [Bacteriovoracaceae bacterium]|nr:LemA family protein [Bacteriovoracaceae bacterium]